MLALRPAVLQGSHSVRRYLDFSKLPSSGRVLWDRTLALRILNRRQSGTLVAYHVLRWCESGTTLFVNNHIRILIHRRLQFDAALRKNKRAVDKDLVLEVRDGDRGRRRLGLGLEKGGGGRHVGSLVGGERFIVARDEERGKDQGEKAVFDRWTVQVKNALPSL